MLDLISATDHYSLAPWWIIRDNLNKAFGGDSWKNYELETISMELGLAFDELLQDKITVIQLLEHGREMYTDDVLFFLHATNVLNNNIASFDNVPMPSSLEIAFAILSVRGIWPEPEPVYSKGIVRTVAYILRQEGYSEPISPFRSMGVDNSALEEGQLPEDTEAKKKGIQLYIKAMSRWPL